MDQWCSHFNIQTFKVTSVFKAVVMFPGPHALILGAISMLCHAMSRHSSDKVFGGLDCFADIETVFSCSMVIQVSVNSSVYQDTVL